LTPIALSSASFPPPTENARFDAVDAVEPAPAVPSGPPAAPAAGAQADPDSFVRAQVRGLALHARQALRPGRRAQQHGQAPQGAQGGEEGRDPRAPQGRPFPLGRAQPHQGREGPGLFVLSLPLLFRPVLQTDPIPALVVSQTRLGCAPPTVPSRSSVARRRRWSARRRATSGGPGNRPAHSRADGGGADANASLPCQHLLSCRVHAEASSISSRLVRNGGHQVFVSRRGPQGAQPVQGGGGETRISQSYRRARDGARTT
jgi:hypothetical protein